MKRLAIIYSCLFVCLLLNNAAVEGEKKLQSRRRFDKIRYQPVDNSENEEEETNYDYDTGKQEPDNIELLNELIEKQKEKVDSINDDQTTQNVNRMSTDKKIKSASQNVASSSSSAPLKKDLNDSSAAKSSDLESNHSWTLFFILCVLGFSILLLHILIKTRFHFLPESVAVVFLGASIGFVINMLSHYKITDFSKEETFTPTMFFLVLLPPIIFESGYNLHKGNFFQNIGSILVFAIFGTAISACVMGTGVYLLGKIGLTYSLNAKESYAFGSLVSAVDPVATLAIFNALDIDPVLYMLVFGESILNDAVAIVLTNTITTLSDSSLAFFDIILFVISRFFLMFFASAAIGCLFGLVSAILFKYIDLRKTPSLETAFMLIFMYSPYVFAEAIHLSGIMAILFAGIVMSHYTHYNLSPVTRITVQQLFRTLAFISETCVFAYLGLAIFSFKHIFKPSLVISSIVMCLAGRAANIFPLATLLNYFREHKITKKMQFIMWFSGLRGAIAFALSLNLQVDNDTRHIIVTSTLILVLFTTLVLGGSTLPFMKFLNADKSNRSRKKRKIILSKTKEMGEAVDLINLLGDESSAAAKETGNGNVEAGTSNSNGGDEDIINSSSVNIHIVRSGVRLKGFARLDENFFRPFFTRKFTDEELRDGQSAMNRLTKQWFDEVNTDAMPTTRTNEDNNHRVYFKKSSSSTTTDERNKSVGPKTTKNKGVVYQNINSSFKSNNVLLESTDEENEYNSDEEEIVIDKQQIKNNYK